MMNIAEKNLNIQSLRAIAISLVVAFHYFSQFTKFPLISEGSVGVQLFFMISGYVISKSLQNSQSLKEFYFKRFFRIYPTLWISIIIILTFLKLFQNMNLTHQQLDESKIQNLIPSLTLIHFDFINKVFGTELTFIEGVLWTLSVEIFFYLSVGVFYFKVVRFCNISKFLFLFTIISLTIFEAQKRVSVLNGFLKPIVGGLEIIGARQYAFFTIGAVFYTYRGKSNTLKIILSVSLLAIIVNASETNQSNVKLLAEILMVILFVITLLNYLPLGKIRFLNRMGNFSYELYLLHNGIGLTSITLVLNNFQLFLWEKVLFVISVFAIMIYISFLFENYVSSPASKYLKAKFVK